MHSSELRELSDTELEEKYDEFKATLFDLRFQLVTGQLDDSSMLRKTKRNIARVMTVQRERALAVTEEVDQ